MKQRILLFLLAWAFSLSAQRPVVVGKGSYAEYTPLYKSRTDEHVGDQSRLMETRKLYITEQNAGLPIPTNDWWTDLLTNTYSGNLWAYPQMVKAEEYGISIAFPKDWEATGHEMKWQSHIEILGKKFKPVSADANRWHDWGFDFLMKDQTKEMRVTLAHGIPFTWLEFKNIELQIRAQNVKYYASDDVAIQLPYTGNALALQIGNDVYGLYVPDGTVFRENDGLLDITFAGTQQYLAVGVLPSRNDLETFAEYAYVVPRQTTVTWNYDEMKGEVSTQWNITTENLKGGTQNKVLQGFIPHHYKNSTLNFSFLPYEYATPRGKMKLSAGNHFSIAYKFNGMLPYFAAPKENIALKNPYQKERMKQMISDYADAGSFGADTYWGGKGLTQMALYMTFAYETGEMELFEKCKNRLKTNLVNWLTYQPGENSFFFARYNRWGAMVGYDTSYDSDTFNDHHFHYGYFTYASALLSLFDEDFRTNYGEMIGLIAKDYANWDKTDQHFPFFRTLDPWAGHSYAGGLGNNGNGQESTSEAMQGWGGLYLLGMATGNKAMRDAGIFGWTLEARGTAEYWFDRDRENIDYTRYKNPYSSNLTSQGVGWWTWFSGDPVWMHSIQWMPISPCLKYLYEDLNFARWDYTQMWTKKEIGDWTTLNGLESSLSYDSGVGNVVLTYLQVFDPDSAASVFDVAWNAQMPIAKNTDTGGITYFVTHSHRTYGDICWDIHGDIPTTTVYKHPQTEKLTYVIYNPESTEKTVRFYQNGNVLQEITVPPIKMTVYSDAPAASSVKIQKPASVVVEPGKTLSLQAHLYDQYGVRMNSTLTWIANSGGQISPEGIFTAGTNKGTDVTVTAQNGTLFDVIVLKINDKPVLSSAQIFPQQDYLEVGKTLEYRMEMTDQYGEPYLADVNWEIEKNGQIVKNSSFFDLQEIGIYTIRAKLNDKEYSTSVYLTPLFANIALNKTATSSSEENAGTLTKHATDGDVTTRWGSEHSDPQWIYVDLGSASYVSAVSILWETAYSSLYDIQISNDKTNWETVQTISCSGGRETTEINRSARYVRIYGRQRATAYGHSLYELEVYGIPPVGTEPVLFGLDMQPRTGFLKEGESIQLAVSGYDQFGQPMAVSPQYRVISGEGSISSSGIFKPSKYGRVVVEAFVNNQTVRADFMVEESLKLQALEISPKKVQLITGVSQRFTCKAKDQFGASFPGESLTYRAVGEHAVMNGSVFSANTPGDYFVIAGSGSVQDTAIVQVAEITAVNLAFMKPVAASSYENAGTVPQNINDGDKTTRWGSGFSDPQTIEIDLLADYKINQIKIFWEAAYATAYSVEVSLNEENWITVYNEANGKGGEKFITFESIPARYVRVTCLKRFMQYGSSIYELEVYGTEYLGGSDTPLQMVRSEEAIQIQLLGRHLSVAGEPLQTVSIYDISGRRLAKADLNGTNHWEQNISSADGIILVAVRTTDGKRRICKFYLR
jgi:endoglucanase Acf2